MAILRGSRVCSVGLIRGMGGSEIFAWLLLMTRQNSKWLTWIFCEEAVDKLDAIHSRLAHQFYLASSIRCLSIPPSSYRNFSRVMNNKYDRNIICRSNSECISRSNPLTYSVGQILWDLYSLKYTNSSPSICLLAFIARDLGSPFDQSSRCDRCDLIVIVRFIF